jgi:predicted PurR-regulated permease PerM
MIDPLPNTVAPASEIALVTTTLRRRQLWLTVVIVGLAVWMAYEFLTPLAWAAVLAMAEWPLYHRLSRHLPTYPTMLAVLFALFTALFVIGPLSLAAVTLAQESDAALGWLAHAQRYGIAAPAWLPTIPLIGTSVASYWQEHVGNPQAANTLLGTLSAASVLGWTRSIGGEVAREAGLFLVTLIALVTLLTRGAAIGRDASKVAARTLGTFGRTFLHRMIVAVRATVNGTILVSVTEGATIGIGYWGANVPQPLLFTTFTIVLALIPFGAWAAFGLASLILIGSGSVLAGALLFAFGVMVMTIGDNVVQPSVIGSAVELPFLLAMIGAFGGLAELGLVGLFVGPVIMAALLLVWQEWMDQAVPSEPPTPAIDPAAL